ncbi:unnamed protein product, partial [Prorocentrum cordatum]
DAPPGRAAARARGRRGEAEAPPGWGGPGGCPGSAADFESALAAPGAVSEKLFELANRPAVRFRVGGGHVEVRQDRQATEHSGGVVWETAFFLARYLERHVLPARGGRPAVAELGAGCGLLGLALARLGCRAVLTEQPAALANLRANVGAYAAAGGARRGAATAAQLVWGNAEDAAAVAQMGPFDLVVASDVVFAAPLVG